MKNTKTSIFAISIILNIGLITFVALQSHRANAKDVRQRVTEDRTRQVLRDIASGIKAGNGQDVANEIHEYLKTGSLDSRGLEDLSKRVGTGSVIAE